MLTRIAVALTVAASSGIFSDLLANCQDGNVYPISQCGDQAWFSVTPLDAGPVSGYFWQLGYGNRTRTATNPGASAANGTGFQPPVTTNGCIGNDSGVLDLPVELDLVDSAFIGGPAGALCFGAGTNWINTGSDGCADNSKNGSGVTSGPNGGSFDDNRLNPYWGTGDYGLGYLTDYYQLDHPMGVLLTEGTGKYFAAAFFATRDRHRDPNDAMPGDFDMGAIVNGDPNPVTLGKNNIIPWQPVVAPQVSVASDPNSDNPPTRTLSVIWDPVRVIHDGSIRPSGAPSLVLANRTGVGVLDFAQGDPMTLVRYVIETAALDSAGCGQFVEALEAPHGQHFGIITIDNATCVRTRTHFGIRPQTFCTGFNSSRGLVGDTGYSVTSPAVLVAGGLASDGIAILSARRQKNQSVTIAFRTASELNVMQLELRGRDARDRDRLLVTIGPKQGTTGLGDSYEITLTKMELRGARTIYVVAQPGGVRSDEVTLGR